MTPAAASNTGAIQINIVDGTRKPVVRIGRIERGDSGKARVKFSGSLGL